MKDVCPLCKTPERRHAADCPEGVPHRVGYFRGIPVVQDMPRALDGMVLVKSDPEHEPNQWHATSEAVEKLRAMGELKELP